MDTVLALIFNNQVLIASCHKIYPMEDDLTEEGCVSRFVSYNFEPELFHLVLTGKDRDVQQFNSKLITTDFPGPAISTEAFVTTCYKIIRQQRLEDLSILIASFHQKPVLHLLSRRGIETESHEGNWLPHLPLSMSSAGNSGLWSAQKNIFDLISNIFRMAAPGCNALKLANDFHYAFIAGEDTHFSIRSYKYGEHENLLFP